MAYDIDDLLSLVTTRRDYIGRTGEPVAGTDISSTLTFGDPVPANGVVTRVEVFGGSVGGSLQIRRFARVGDVFTQVGSPLSLTVVANELNTFDGLSFEVLGGEYIGSYGAAGVRCYTTTGEDNPGWYYGAGDVSSFTDADTNENLRIEMRITLDHVALTEAALKTSQAAVPATGHERILRDYLDAAGNLAGEIGLQHVDDQDPQALFYRVRARGHATRFDFTTYQYGGTIKGGGDFGDTIELQLGSDTDPTRKPVLSIRDRDGNEGNGSAVQTRSGSDLWGFGIFAWDEAFPFVGTFEDIPETPRTLWLNTSVADGGWGFAVQQAEVARYDARGFQFRARDGAPEPDEDSFIPWQQVGGENDGDLCVTINCGGVVRTATLVDFSELPEPEEP